MKSKPDRHAASYEAALTESQRIALHSLLLSGITLAEAREKAPPWPDGPDQGKKPCIACLGKIRLRLGIEERVARIEESKATLRATRQLLRSLVNQTDQEQILDEAMTLIGRQVIDLGLDLNNAASNTGAAWVLLRRADQRRFDQRTAIFQAQSGKNSKTDEDPPLPPLTNEERERKYRQIFGMEPI